MSLQNCRIAGYNVDSREYHAQKIPRGAPEFPVSPSVLKEFMRCPSRWIRGYSSPDSESKDWGNLVDCLLLTPSQFAHRYAPQPTVYPAPKHHAKVKSGAIKEGDPLPWTNNAAYCDEWTTTIKSHGLAIIKQADREAAEVAISVIREDEALTRFIEESDKQVLVTGEWKAGNGLIIPLRCLIDLAPFKDSIFNSCLGDVKTGTSAGQQAFARLAHRLGYHLQAAFDLDLWNKATGEMRTDWCLIIQESFPPWQVGKRFYSEDYLNLARKQYGDALELYAKCLASNKWPSYDDTREAINGWSLICPEPWMESEVLFATELETENEPEEQLSQIPS